MKSITPVISVILLVMITIVASVTAFFFVNNMGDDLLSQTSGQASQTTSYCSRIRLLSMDADVIRVQNNGCGNIDSVVVFINGEPTTFNLAYPLGEGEVGEIPLSNLDIGYYEVEIMLDNGLTQIITYNSTQTSTNFVYTYPISYFAGQNSLLLDTNLPNNTFIRLPSNANITSLFLTINTPKVFSKNSLNFQIDIKNAMLGVGFDGENLFLLHDTDSSSAIINANLSIYNYGETSVNLIDQYNLFNISTSVEKESFVTFKNGFIHGFIKTSNNQGMYFNYSVLTHTLANSTIDLGDYKILRLIVDNDNNKYFFYTNSTNSNSKYLFVSTSKNGGFYNFLINSSLLNMPILFESTPYDFYFENTTETFHAVVARKYNDTVSDAESYFDVVYIKSNDGITWDAPETIISLSGYDYLNIVYAGFYLNSNPSGDALLIFADSALGGTDSYIYKKLSGSSWQKIKQINYCLNGFESQNVIVNFNNENNIVFFCLPINGFMSFDSINNYYESNDFGSSWSGPYIGFSAITEGELPLGYFALKNSDNNMMGASLDVDLDSALSVMMNNIPGEIGYRLEGNPFISLKVGNSFVLTNYSLTSRSYSVDIKDYVTSYLSSCSHSCDVPIYLDSNSSMNVNLIVSGNYQLSDFQMYSLSSGVSTQHFFNSESTQSLNFNVLKNQSISGVSVNLNFKEPEILNTFIGVNLLQGVKGLPIYGDKDLLIISSSIIHDDDFFDLKISKSTDLGETWSDYETVINNCSFISDTGITYNSMDLKDNYLHGFVNRTLYFNYSLTSQTLITENFSEVFAQDVYSSKLSNDLFILYINLSDDYLYFAKNNDYANAVKINDSLLIDYSDLYNYFIPGGAIVENEAGIHLLVVGLDGNNVKMYYFNSSNNGVSWNTHVVASFIKPEKGSILPLNILANGEDIFIYFSVANGEPFNPYYGYVRFIDGVLEDINYVYGPTYFTADNNGSTIYASVNIPVSVFPRNNNGFITKSEDFGATWSTPVYGFKNFNVTTMASYTKFFFDMPYVYGFYMEYNPFPTKPYKVFNKFVETKSVNPKLSINNNIVWQASGAQSGLINISGFNSTINTYTSTCQTESCTIPFFFNSSSNNNFELSYFGVTTESTKCSISNPCDDNNVCTYNNCIGNACQFMPIQESNVTGCALTIGCFNEYRGDYGINCRCLEGRCRDSCGDNICQAWESASSCTEDCLGFFPNQVIQLNDIDEVSGFNANYGMCAMDFTGNGNVEIVTVEKGSSSYNLTIYNYTSGEIVFEREKEIPHSGNVYPINVYCGNLSISNDLKVVVAGYFENGSNDEAFIDIINITSSLINIENSSEFFLVNESNQQLDDNYVYGLVTGDLDSSGDNEIYILGKGYSGYTRYNLIYKYNYTDNALILDDKKNKDDNYFFLSEMIVSNFNDSKSSNELIFTTPNYEGNSNKLLVYSYDNGLKLDNTISLSSITDYKTSIYVKDLNGDLKDELIVLYQSSSNPYKSTLKVYSIDSGILNVLDSKEIYIDSKNTYSVSLIVDDFDDDDTSEIVLFLMNGNCPGGLYSYFRIYNFTDNQLNFESQRKINSINNLELANIASYILSKFQSAKINQDNVSDLIMSGFLTDSSCSLFGNYYNSFVLFDYKNE